MRKIAVFGGTFNPIHEGHLHLCRECDKVLGFDEILLMPTNVPPHKKPDHLLSNEDRLAMCRLACEWQEKIRVSDLEMQMQGVSYTVYTVKELRKQYPDAELYWIVGSDMLLSFHQWYQYEEILKEISLVAGAREAGEYEQMSRYATDTLSGYRVYVIPIKAVEVSSTEIREQLVKGEKPKLLPEAVYAYIMEKGLFGTKEACK